MINRTTFYAYVKRAPFGGRLSPQQQDGLERILTYWDTKYPKSDIRWLAYILATVFHETDATIQPVKEKGGEKYLRSKKYYPWYGRGLVQITWEANYKKYGIVHPDDALTWTKSLYVLFHGMIYGTFTGKKLGHYFTEGVEDPRGARRIINGTDKAGLIADYYQNFLGALNASLQEEPPVDATPEQAAADITPFFKDPQAITGTAGGLIATVVAAVNSPWGVASLGVLVAAGLILAFLFLRKKEKYVKGV